MIEPSPGVSCVVATRWHVEARPRLGKSQCLVGSVRYASLSSRRSSADNSPVAASIKRCRIHLQRSPTRVPGPEAT